MGNLSELKGKLAMYWGYLQRRHTETIGKKGQLGTLQSIVMTLVFIGILLGAGFLILEEFKDQMTAGSEAEDALNETIFALKKVPTWLSIIVVLAIVGILIAIVFAVLPRGRGTQV